MTSEAWVLSNCAFAKAAGLRPIDLKPIVESMPRFMQEWFESPEALTPLTRSRISEQIRGMLSKSAQAQLLDRMGLLTDEAFNDVRNYLIGREKSLYRYRP